MGARALLAGAVAATALAGAATAPPASAKDPGRWKLVRQTSTPRPYDQGVTTVPGGFAFTGTNALYLTDRRLRRQRSQVLPFPTPEGYDHVGDLSFDRTAEGGRLLLALECYRFGAPGGTNTCGRGAFAVADPATLQFRYHVNLDPADIQKAMWVEVTPDGQWLYTQAGRDLLRYDATQVNPANAAPGGPLLRPVTRFTGALASEEPAGSTWFEGRLYLGQLDGRRWKLWRIDPHTGKRRLEIDRPSPGEPEGLVTVRRFAGRIHATFNRGLTSEGVMLSFRPRR